MTLGGTSFNFLLQGEQWKAHPNKVPSTCTFTLSIRRVIISFDEDSMLQREGWSVNNCSFPNS